MRGQQECYISSTGPRTIQQNNACTHALYVQDYTTWADTCNYRRAYYCDTVYKPHCIANEFRAATMLIIMHTQYLYVMINMAWTKTMLHISCVKASVKRAFERQILHTHTHNVKVFRLCKSTHAQSMLAYTQHAGFGNVIILL